MIAILLGLGACAGPDEKPSEISDFFRRWGDELRANPPVSRTIFVNTPNGPRTCHQFGNHITCN